MDQDNNFEIELASSKKETRQEPEGQLTVDVYETGDEIVIRSTIAGVNREDIDIAITKDMITIRGKRIPEEKIKATDYFYQELYWGPFSRSVILPVDIQVDGAKASLKNGILTVRLPKLEKNQMRKIRIGE